MAVLKAGYIIDEIFNQYKNCKTDKSFEELLSDFKRLCFFETQGLEEFETVTYQDSTRHQILAVLHNLITRGTPTRANIFLTEKILSIYGFEKKVNKNLGDIYFTIQENSISTINYLPIVADNDSNPLSLF